MADKSQIDFEPLQADASSDNAPEAIDFEPIDFEPTNDAGLVKTRVGEEASIQMATDQNLGMGDLKRQSDLQTKIYGLDQPDATEKIEQNLRLKAISGPLLRYAAPAPEIWEKDIPFVQKEYAQAGQKITEQEAREIAKQRQLEIENAYPTESTGGTVLGLGLGGALAGGIGGIANTGARQLGGAGLRSIGVAAGRNAEAAILGELADIGSQMGIAAADAAVRSVNDPEANLKAEAGKAAILTGALMSLFKVPALGKAAMQDFRTGTKFFLQDTRDQVAERLKLLRQAETGLRKDVASQEQKLVDINLESKDLKSMQEKELGGLSTLEREAQEREAGLLSDIERKEASVKASGTAREKRLLNRQADAESVATKQISEIDEALTSAHISREGLNEQLVVVDDILSNQKQYTDGMTFLKDSVKQDLDGRLNTISTALNERLDQFSSQRLRFDREFERAKGKLLSLTAYEGAVEGARKKALKAIDAVEQGLNPKIITTEADPITGKAGSKKIMRIASVREANEAKKQLQDLLYDREFLASAHPQVKNAVKEFERSMRNRISSVDPTGQLRALNNGFHALKTASDQADDILGDQFIQSLSKGDVDLIDVNRKLENLFDLLTPEEQLAQKGSKFYSGLNSEAMQNAVVKQQVEEAKAALRAKVDVSTTNYGKYLEAKNLRGELAKEAEKLDLAIEKYTQKKLDTSETLSKKLRNIEDEQFNLQRQLDERRVALERRREVVTDKTQKSKLAIDAQKDTVIQKTERRLKELEKEKEAATRGIEKLQLSIERSKLNARNWVFNTQEEDIADQLPSIRFRLLNALRKTASRGKARLKLPSMLDLSRYPALQSTLKVGRSAGLRGIATNASTLMQQRQFTPGGRQEFTGFDEGEEQ